MGVERLMGFRRRIGFRVRKLLCCVRGMRGWLKDPLCHASNLGGPFRCNRGTGCVPEGTPEGATTQGSVMSSHSVTPPVSQWASVVFVAPALRKAEGVTAHVRL